MIQQEQQRQLTIHEIARMADTSKSTVSRVLTDHPAVAPETRARIREIMREHKFQPNPFARGLAGLRYAHQTHAPA